MKSGHFTFPIIAAMKRKAERRDRRPDPNRLTWEDINDFALAIPGVPPWYTEWFLETQRHAYSDLPPLAWLSYDSQRVTLLDGEVEMSE